MSLFARLSLRQMLTLPYVALVAALALAIGTLSYQAGREAVDSLSDRLLTETANRLTQAVQAHVSASHDVLELAFPEGLVAPERLADDLAGLRTRFWLATSAHRDPNNYAYYGAADGDFFGLWRHDARQAELRLRLGGEGPRQIRRFEGLQGELQAPAAEQRLYDPRSRPWYQAALAKGHVTWTPIYIDFRTGGLVTTLARPVPGPDGQPRGVVATDLSLDQIDDFMRGLSISRNGLAFVVESDGQLIGASQGRHVKPMANGLTARLSAAESDNPLIAATYEAFMGQIREPQEQGARTEVLTLADGRRVQVAHAHLGDGAGLDWTVLVAVPREDFLQHVTANFQQTALVGAAALLAVLLLGLGVLNVVARDLRHLAGAARRIGEGQLELPRSLDRRDEIGDLARSFAGMQQRLMTDALTGLSNREAILRRIEERIGQHRRRGDDRSFAVMFVDLNQFKRINDALGHDVGDRVLQEIATRLRAAVRTDDLVARYAGDEFLLMLDTLADRDAAERVREQIERSLAQPSAVLQELGDATASAGAAVGLALFPDDARDVDSLVRHADADMYRRKGHRSG